MRDARDLLILQPGYAYGHEYDFGLKVILDGIAAAQTVEQGKSVTSHATVPEQNPPDPEHLERHPGPEVPHLPTAFQDTTPRRV